MGHRGRIDDQSAVKAVAAAVLALAREHVFPGKSEFLVEFPAHKVEATSFDAHLRIQTDRLDCQTNESRTMVVVRFAPPGQRLNDDPWSLRVRRNWPDRKDRLPDASRASSRGLRQAVRRLKDGEFPEWGRYEDLWLSESPSVPDLEAQIALFLLQVGLVPADDPVRDELLTYLRREFSWRGVDGPEAATFLVYEHLRKRKRWPADWRAWRLYVSKCIEGERRKQRPREATAPDLTPDQDGRLTVDQVAITCRMSRSKVYDLVRLGRVSTETRKDDWRDMIPSSEAERLKAGVRRRDVIALAEKCRGTRAAAARKWVYRQELAGKTLDEIAGQLVKQTR
jgi:hypothetical protein